MAVTPSPFSKRVAAKPRGYGFDEEGNPVYVNTDGTVMQLSVGKGKGEKPKSTFAQEQTRLEAKTRQIVGGLANNPALSFAQQAEARAAAMTVAAGGKASVKDKGVLGTLLGGIASVPAKAAGKAFDVYQKAVEPFQSAGQSFTKELVDLMSGQGFSIDDLIAQSRMDNFKAGNALNIENKFVRGIGNFVLDTVFDPTTYLTLGASAASKATRFALANKAALLAPKYPELKPLLSNIARYGATEIPKHIREAEGIAAGVKYMGKEIPYSSGLAKAWRYSFGAARANIGDVVAKTDLGKVVLQKTTTSSLRDLTLKGFGRAATQNIYNPEFVQGLMEMSASSWAKGTYKTALDTAVGQIKTIMDQAREVGMTDESIGQVYRAIELGSSDGLSEPAKELYDFYKGWSDTLRNEVVALQRNLGDEYGLAVSEMGFLDNHLFHKITPEARAWSLGSDTVTRSGYRSAELTERDLWENSGTMMFRKIRGPIVDENGKVISKSKFLGREVDDATIDGLNKISQEELGFKWFEDDLGNIAQGYAESIARAKSRIAYVNKAMSYGPDAIKPTLIKEIVPDEGLVADLTLAQKKLVKAQKALRKKIYGNARLAGTREGVATEAEAFAKILDDVLEGRYLEYGVRDEAIDQVRAEFDDIFDVIESARLKSLRVSQDAKGEFDDLWGGYLRESEALRDALANNTFDRYVLLQDFRTEYARLAGVSADAAEFDGKSLEWFAERIKRLQNGGASEPREQARLLARRKQLRASLDEMPSTAQFDESRKRVVDELDRVDKELEGVRILSDVRANASYANDGVIWGSVPDATDAEAPFQMWTTKPVDDEFGTFGRMPDSLMGHAISEDELIDFRNAEMMAQLVSMDTVSDTVARVLREVGLEDPTWGSIVQGAMETGVIDDTLRMVSPAKADLLEGFMNFARMVDDAIEQGNDLSTFEIDSFFGWLRENFQAVAREYSDDNIDAVANSMLHNFLRGITDDAVDSGFRGTLVPMQTMFPEMAGVSSDWAVLLPKDTPTPAVGVGVTDEWQTVVDNPLAQRLLNGSTESYELDLMSKGDSLRTEGLDLQALSEARDALAKELDSITNPVDDLLERAKTAETVRYNGIDIPVKKARKQLAAMDAVLARETANVDRQVGNLLKDEFGLTDEAQRLAMSAEERLPILLDNATAMTNWDETMGRTILNEVDNIKLLLTRKPAKGSTGASNAAWVKAVEDALRNSALLDFDPALRDAYDRVLGLIHLGEIDLAKIDGELTEVSLKLSKAQAGEIGKVIWEDFQRGWDIIEGLGVQVPKDIKDRFGGNIKKLRDTAEAEKLFKFVSSLNTYWKRYVTASVGFFMRNGLSGTFMNYADGVGFREMNEGLRWAFAQAETKGRVRTGKTYANWMARAGITDEAEAEAVMKIVGATGRGQSDDFAIPSFGLEGARGNVVKRANNAYLGFFSRKNDIVENALRIPMALDSVRRGHSFEEAVARIRRVHFDYTDLSQMDEAMKKVVPFWLWTSRNIPLQVSQMITRPKAYVQYERLKREFPVNSELMVPSWIQKSGPLGVAANMVLTPDLPQVRLADNLKQIATPSGLMGQATPLLRVPFELWYGKQVALDIPFGDKRTAAGVEKAVGRVVNALTGTQWAEVDEATGKVMIDPRVTYVIENAAPTLAQAFRLSGGKLGGKDTLEERWVGSVLSWFGVPIRNIGEQQQRSEAIRRQYNLGDLEKELKAIVESSRPNP